MGDVKILGQGMGKMKRESRTIKKKSGEGYERVLVREWSSANEMRNVAE